MTALGIGCSFAGRNQRSKGNLLQRRRGSSPLLGMKLLSAGLLCFVALSAEKPHAGLTGTVLSEESTQRFLGYFGSGGAPKLNIPASSTPVWATGRKYVLATDTTLYLFAESGAKFNIWLGSAPRTLLVTGTVVHFYVDGSRLAVIDNDGHARREILLAESPEPADFDTHPVPLTEAVVLRVAGSGPDISAPPALAGAHPSPAREHTIQDVSGNGEVILLDDSVWRIKSFFTFHVALWLPYTRVAVVRHEDGAFTLVHLSDGETADAERIE